MEQKYVMAAIDAALKAGGKILSIYNDPASDFEIERKADNSPLTIADRKAHEAIVAILNDTPFPILSEEGKHLPYAERCGWNECLHRLAEQHLLRLIYIFVPYMVSILTHSVQN